MSGISNDSLCGDKGEQQTSSGVPMTRPYFVGKVTEVLSLVAQSFAGHSFRVGAAMTTAMVAMKIC